MKIDVGAMPREVYDGTPQVGDVYAIQGGTGKGRRFRIVVAMPSNQYNDVTCFCLIIDREGEIVGADRCADHYLERKGRIGTCDLSALETLRVDWL